MRNWVVLLALACAVWPATVRGNLLTTWGPSAGSWSHVAGYLSSGQLIGPVGPPSFSEGLGSLTLGPDGKFYVLNSTMGIGNVLRFTLQSPAFEWLIQDPLGSSFTLPSGIAFDHAGQLYAGSSAFLPSGKTGDPVVYRVGSTGLRPVVGLSGELQTGDIEIEFDPAGNLFVAFDGLGIRRYAGTGPGPTFTIPVATHDFHFGPDGKLYVATASQGVLTFDPATGAALGTFVPAGSQGLIDADHMAFGGDGVLYVNSPGAQKIFKFDATTGAPLGTFTDYSAQPGTHITSIAYTDQPLPEPHAGLAMVFGAAWAFGRRPRRAKSDPAHVAI